MSYYATGSGNIKVKMDAPIMVVRDILENVFSDTDFYNGIFSVSFDGKYCESDIYEAFDKIEPYVKEYDIDFEGEDGALWTISTGADEDSGSIIYRKDSLRKLVKAGFSSKKRKKILRVLGV